jgi:hypothetical protein
MKMFAWVVKCEVLDIDDLWKETTMIFRTEDAARSCPLLAVPSIYRKVSEPIKLVPAPELEEAKAEIQRMKNLTCREIFMEMTKEAHEEQRKWAVGVVEYVGKLPPPLDQLAKIEAELEELRKAVRWINTIADNYDFIDLKEICEARLSMLYMTPEDIAAAQTLLKVLEEK